VLTLSARFHGGKSSAAKFERESWGATGYWKVSADAGGGLVEGGVVLPLRIKFERESRGASTGECEGSIAARDGLVEGGVVFPCSAFFASSAAGFAKKSWGASLPRGDGKGGLAEGGVRLLVGV
jgi:hypothetical protein